MAHQVTVNVDNIEVGGAVYDTGAVVTVTDETYDELVAADRFNDGTLTDGGAVPDDDGDAVYAAGTAPALTSTVAAGATPTKAEFDALRADLVALQAALTGAGKPFTA